MQGSQEPASKALLAGRCKCRVLNLHVKHFQILGRMAPIPTCSSWTAFKHKPSRAT